MTAERSVSSLAVEGAIYGFAFAVGWVAAMVVLGAIATA